MRTVLTIDCTSTEHGSVQPHYPMIMTSNILVTIITIIEAMPLICMAAMVKHKRQTLEAERLSNFRR